MNLYFNNLIPKNIPIYFFFFVCIGFLYNIYIYNIPLPILLTFFYTIFYYKELIFFFGKRRVFLTLYLVMILYSILLSFFSTYYVGEDSLRYTIYYFFFPIWFFLGYQLRFFTFLIHLDDFIKKLVFFLVSILLLFFLANLLYNFLAFPNGTIVDRRVWSNSLVSLGWAEPSGIIRFSGTFLDPNYSALSYCILLMITFFAYLDKQVTKISSTFVIFVLVVLLSVGLTLSRGGILFSGFIILSIIFSFNLYKNFYIFILSFCLFAILILFGLGYIQLPDRFNNRLEDDQRLVILENNIRVFTDNPFGLGSFLSIRDQFGNALSSHNTIFHILLSLGLFISLIIFFSFLSLIFKHRVSFSVKISYFGFILSIALLDYLFYSLLWIFFGYLFNLISLQNKRD